MVGGLKAASLRTGADLAVGLGGSRPSTPPPQKKIWSSLFGAPFIFKEKG